MWEWLCARHCDKSRTKVFIFAGSDGDYLFASCIAESVIAESVIAESVIAGLAPVTRNQALLGLLTITQRLCTNRT